MIPNGQNRAGACHSCTACPEKRCTFRCFDPGGRFQHKIRLRRGERLEGHADEACLQFWIVVSGSAATCTAFADGRRQILWLENPGDVVHSVIAGPGSQNWFEALSDCVVCELDLTPLAGQLNGNSEFFTAAFRSTHQRLRRSQAHMTTLGRLDSRERVLLFLAEMALKSGHGPVTLTMSREDIADYLGLNSETVSRILTRLKKSGLVRFLSPTEYVVPDFEALARRLPVPLPVPESGAITAMEKSA